MPPAVVAAVAIVGSVASGVASKNASSGAQGNANDAANIAFQKLSEVGLPPDTAKAIVYQQFQQKGIMTPDLEQHINQTASQMANVQGSSQAQGAQMQALQALQQRGQTGLTPEDRAALNQVRQQTATDTQAKQQQIMQDFAARGQGGSGASLIAALQGAQSGANAESQAGDRLSAMASQNALQAIGQAGTLGGQIQQQQFGEQAQKAQAQDVINQFNTQNQIGQQARNVQAQNAAQQSNLANAQNLSNANTQQANQELLRQNQAQQQDWEDTVQRAQVQAGGANTYAQQQSQLAQQQGASAAAPYAAIGAGGMTAATSMMKNQNSGNYNGGEIKGYDDGGPVIDPAAAQSAQDSMRKAFGYNNGGNVRHYDDGTDSDGVKEPTFAEKLSNYFSDKPVNQQTVNPNAAQQVSDSFKSATYAQGGVVDPQFMKLKRMFPHTAPEVLRDIHAKANPAPMGSPMVPPAAMPMMPKIPSRGFTDGGGVRQPDEHFMRSGVTDYRAGGHVPGQAPVPGDSPKNDIVDAKLSPGEFVIKRSQAKSPFGQKIIKLLQAHSEVMKHDKGE